MGHVFEWEEIYTLPRIVASDSKIRIFQYNILHNVLYLNKKLFEFNKINSPECSLCKCEEERSIHLFHICRKTQALWTELTSHLDRHLNLPHFTLQSAIFGFLDISNKDYLIVNHLLLLFKYYIYNARDRKHLVFEVLMKNIKNIYDTEKNLSDQNPHQKTKVLTKWQSVECALR